AARRVGGKYTVQYREVPLRLEHPCGQTSARAVAVEENTARYAQQVVRVLHGEVAVHGEAAVHDHGVTIEVQIGAVHGQVAGEREVVRQHFAVLQRQIGHQRAGQARVRAGEIRVRYTPAAVLRIDEITGQGGGPRSAIGADIAAARRHRGGTVHGEVAHPHDPGGIGELDVLEAVLGGGRNQHIERLRRRTIETRQVRAARRIGGEHAVQHGEVPLRFE